MTGQPLAAGDAGLLLVRVGLLYPQHGLATVRAYFGDRGRIGHHQWMADMLLLRGVMLEPGEEDMIPPFYPSAQVGPPQLYATPSFT